MVFEDIWAVKKIPTTEYGGWGWDGLLGYSLMNDALCKKKSWGFWLSLYFDEDKGGNGDLEDINSVVNN